MMHVQEWEPKMKRRRVDARLDLATKRKIAEVAAARGSSVSGLVRVLIERSYEEEVAKARLTVLERIGAMEVEGVPEPKELKRQFAEAQRVDSESRSVASL
jgi:hypothetical protein